MKKIINFIKMDYKNVKSQLEYTTNRELPNGVVIVYYAILAPLGFIMVPFVLLWTIYKINKIYKEEA